EAAGWHHPTVGPQGPETGPHHPTDGPHHRRLVFARRSRAGKHRPTAAMSPGGDDRRIGMTYAPVNGLQLYFESRGSGRPLVLLPGGLLTIDLSFGPLLAPLAEAHQVIAVELQGHGHTADIERPMTIEALASDVVGLLDHLQIAEADVLGFSLG